MKRAALAGLLLPGLLHGCGAPEESRGPVLYPREGKWIVLKQTWDLKRGGEEITDPGKAEIDAYAGKFRSHCFTLEDLRRVAPHAHLHELRELEDGDEERDEASFGTPGYADFRFRWHLGNHPSRYVVNPRGSRPGSTFGLAAEQEAVDTDNSAPLARYLEMQPYVITYLNAPWGVPNDEGYSVMRVVPSGWSLTRSGEEMTGLEEWSYYTRGCPNRPVPADLGSASCKHKAGAWEVQGVIDLVACKNICATTDGCVSGVYASGGARCFLYGSMKDSRLPPNSPPPFERACLSVSGPRTHTIFDCGEGDCLDDSGCGVTEKDQCEVGDPTQEKEDQELEVEENQKLCCECGGGTNANAGSGAGSKLVVGHDHILALWLGEGRWFENEECPVTMFDQAPWRNAPISENAEAAAAASALELGAESVGKLAHHVYAQVAGIAEARPST